MEINILKFRIHFSGRGITITKNHKVLLVYFLTKPHVLGFYWQEHTKGFIAPFISISYLK